MARLVGRVAFGQVAPGSAGAQDPEDAVEHVPRVPPRSAPPVLSARRLWDEWPQNLPLLVGKVHALSLLSRETTRGPLYASTHVYEIASRHLGENKEERSTAVARGKATGLPLGAEIYTMERRKMGISQRREEAAK